MAEWRPTLETWSVATFDLVLLALVVLLVAFPTGGLGDALGDLNTIVGVALFGYLWVLVVVAVTALTPDGGFADASPGTLAAHAALAGMAVAVGFVLGIVGVAFFPAVVRGSASLGGVLFVGVAGATVAAAVGLVVGVVLGLLDAAVARGADALLDAGGGGLDRGETVTAAGAGGPSDESDGTGDRATTRDRR